MYFFCTEVDDESLISAANCNFRFNAVMKIVTKTQNYLQKRNKESEETYSLYDFRQVSVCYNPSKTIWHYF